MEDIKRVKRRNRLNKKRTFSRKLQQLVKRIRQGKLPENICTVCKELEKDGDGICYYLSNKHCVAMRPKPKSECVAFKRA